MAKQDKEQKAVADPVTPSVPDQARLLLRSADRAALATVDSNGSGQPYASLVLMAAGADAAPILHLSDLAEHTKNLKLDSRISLLVDGTLGLEHPLTGSRATIVGRAEVTTDQNSKARYLRRHPAAVGYAEFADFNFYRVAVERVHLVAGFGKIDWVDGNEVLLECSRATALIDAETEIVAHMNEDHSDAVQLYATRLLGLEERDWTMTGVDPEGCDLRSGGQTARVQFDKPINTADAARGALVRLVKRARSMQS